MSDSRCPSALHSGARLRAALTDAQLGALLDTVVTAGVLPQLDPLLRSADPDMADTVRRFLDAGASPATEIATSDRRARELWQQTWSRWESCVGELGDDTGDYANHDEHWHPPYFEVYALAEDLDAVALALSGQLERAFPLVGEPGLFEKALAEVDEGIASYPDSMQMNEEVCVLGPHATTCALRWIWLAVAAEATPGAALVARFWKLENGFAHVKCDVAAAARFFAELPEVVCREIFARLRQPDMEDAVANTRLVWHRIQHDYERRFDSAAHLRSCEEGLERNWHYGEPLIAAALARNDYVAADVLIARTVSSLLRFNDENPWLPEEPLWEAHGYWSPAEKNEALLALLSRWEAVAEAGGDLARAASCRLQRVFRTAADNWTTVFTAFDEFRTRGGKPDVGEKLFDAWRAQAVDSWGSHAGQPESTRPDQSWPARLIDAIRDPSTRREQFLKHLEVWLQACREHGAFFTKQWRLLAVLTRSLPQHERIKTDYPSFSTRVLQSAGALPGGQAKCVREALAALELDAARVAPMPAWAEHLHTLVPSPAESSSLYTEHAGWMKALSELNRPRYDAMLARWRTEFSRRRNLWKDMQAAGCPGC